MGKNQLTKDHVCNQKLWHPRNATWQEVYQGCVHAEWEEFQDLAIEIMQVQLRNQKAASAGGAPHPVDRAFHAKPTLAADDAELRFLDALPAELQFGEFAAPGRCHRTQVRFSNANGRQLPDQAKDMRGVALRVTVDSEEQHDLLLTNSPVSHARNARQFVKFAKATAGRKRALLPGLIGLAREVGVSETVRMVCNVWNARTTVPSIATEIYWSRGAIRWGDVLAVRYVLKPAPDTAPPGPMDSPNPDYLFEEVSKRLERGPVRFVLNVQKFVNAKDTPIEDTSVEWATAVSPLVPVAELTIPQRDRKTWPSQFAPINFNPWNTTDEFKPLGNLNRARRASYDAGADLRNKLRWQTEPPRRNVVLGAGARGFFRLVNRFRPWYRLGVKSGLINILALRQTLQRDNRIDTESIEVDAPPRARKVPPPPPPDAARIARRPDGSYNDLSVERMGAVGASFGRNLRPKFEPATLNTPNPVEISDRLLARQGFRPATSLNVLAAAWIQFQIHDWVNHERHPLGGETDVVVPLPPGSNRWASSIPGDEENVMRIAGNTPSNPEDPESPLRNKTTFWGDASEIYGTTADEALGLRDGAKLKLPGGYLPDGPGGVPVSGFTEAWWLGLSALHTLFAREHNVVCAELQARYPEMGDDQRYQTARLIVSALITKIHTLEWTPAILARKTLEIGMNANWSGPTDWLTRLSTWLIDDHASKGIPATFPEHRGVPFSLTEDFTAVYRFHPLLPDDYSLRDHTDNSLLDHYDFRAIAGSNAETVMRERKITDVLYSFGIAHPGAITLHNFPSALRRFERASEGVAQTEIIDLAVVDLIRTRQRGVPRYNDFRAGLHLPRITKWADLSTDPADVWLLKQIYGSIDEIDTMVGLFAETPPEGFGFSDTAFRIFISTATNRIQSDRFLTVDFRPEVYSPLGMDWIKNNTMRSVILRHCPELAAVVPQENAFAPWRPADGW